MARMTKRQRECQKIAKEKARKLRMRTWWRRTYVSVLGLTALFAGANGWLMYRSGEITHWVEAKEKSFFDKTLAMGFVVKNIYLEGRKEAPMNEVVQALGLKIGDPLLATSVSTLKSRLEGLDWIEYAAVERVLPDTLHVHIVERRPVAIWQNEGKLTLVDIHGVVMERQQVSHYAGLPMLVGEDAPAHTSELLHFLAKEPQLFSQVTSAIRVSERRWNIRFKNGIEVKLPEQGEEDAWHHLAQLEKTQKVLSRDIVAVDMRLADRVSFKLSPGAVKHQPGSAKET